MQPDAIISVSKKAFLKEATLAACVELQDKSGVFLASESKDGQYIEVSIKASREAGGPAAIENIASQFEALLADKHIQFKLLKSNAEACGEIAFNALSNPVFFEDAPQDDQIPESIAKLLEESPSGDDESYLDDPLNIAVPWEEQNKK